MALERALRTSGEDRRAAIEDALLFRRERHRLVGSAAAQEFALETAEGLAEYTGIRLSGMSTDEQLAYAARQLAERPAQFPTFNRSFAYLTGPAYGLLLDTTNQPWRTGLAAGANLAQRLQDLLGMKLPDTSPDDLARRADRYDGTALRQAELDRAEARRVRHAALHKQYFEDAVLTLPLEKMQITFDPRNIETVGELGDVLSDSHHLGSVGKTHRHAGRVPVGRLQDRQGGGARRSQSQPADRHGLETGDESRLAVDRRRAPRLLSRCRRWSAKRKPMMRSSRRSGLSAALRTGAHPARGCWWRCPGGPTLQRPFS